MKRTLRKWFRKTILRANHFANIFLRSMEGKKMLLALLPPLVSLVVLKTFKAHIGIFVSILFLLFIGILVYKDPDLDRKLLKTKFIENLVFIGIKTETLFYTSKSFQISVGIILGQLILHYQEFGYVILTLTQFFASLYRILRRDLFSTEKFVTDEINIFVDVSRETIVSTFFTITGREVSTKYKTGPGATLGNSTFVNRARSMKTAAKTAAEAGKEFGKKVANEAKDKAPGAVVIGTATAISAGTGIIVYNRLNQTDAVVNGTIKRIETIQSLVDNDFRAARKLEIDKYTETLKNNHKILTKDLDTLSKEVISRNRNPIRKVVHGADCEFAHDPMNEIFRKSSDYFPGSKAPEVLTTSTLETKKSISADSMEKTVKVFNRPKKGPLKGSHSNKDQESGPDKHSFHGHDDFQDKGPKISSAPDGYATNWHDDFWDFMFFWGYILYTIIKDVFF